MDPKRIIISPKAVSFNGYMSPINAVGKRR